MVQAGIRVPPETLARLKERARIEGRTVSNLGMIAVHAWLAGGADRYLELAAQAAATPQPDPVPVEVIRYGERIRKLPEQLQVKVLEYADALELLYAKRRESNGSVVLAVGTVRNTWVAPDTAGTAVPRRKGRTRGSRSSDRGSE